MYTAKVGAAFERDPSEAEPTSEADARDGPAALYLTPTSALVVTSGGHVDETIYEVIDLTTGGSSVAYTVGFLEGSLIDTWPYASLTRPDGETVFGAPSRRRDRLAGAPIT